MTFGLIGIFVGPVVLAVAHTLLEAWANGGGRRPKGRRSRPLFPADPGSARSGHGGAGRRATSRIVSGEVALEGGRPSTNSRANAPRRPSPSSPVTAYATTRPSRRTPCELETAPAERRADCRRGRLLVERHERFCHVHDREAREEERPDPIGGAVARRDVRIDHGALPPADTGTGASARASCRLTLSHSTSDAVHPGRFRAEASAAARRPARRRGSGAPSRPPRSPRRAAPNGRSPGRAGSGRSTVKTRTATAHAFTRPFFTPRVSSSATTRAPAPRPVRDPRAPRSGRPLGVREPRVGLADLGDEALGRREGLLDHELPVRHARYPRAAPTRSASTTTVATDPRRRRAAPGRVREALEERSAAPPRPGGTRDSGGSPRRARERSRSAPRPRAPSPCGRSPRAPVRPAGSPPTPEGVELLDGLQRFPGRPAHGRGSSRSASRRGSSRGRRRRCEDRSRRHFPGLLGAM